MTCATYNFEVCKGQTFLYVVRWASGPFTSKAISAISKAAPMVVTAAGHSVPAGWPAAVVGSQGMTEANSAHYPPVGTDWHSATVVDANNVSFNDVSSAAYGTHTANSGFLVYPTPVTLTGVTAAFTVYDNIEQTGTPLLSLAGGSGITLDNTAKTISIQFATAALTWDFGYYTLACTDTGGVIHHLLEGTVSIT